MEKPSFAKKSSPYVLEAKNIYKTYYMGKTEVNALKGINLKVKTGEYISIMGSSGSGKSTLLHILGALLRPTKGEVFLKGKAFSQMSDDELAKIRGKTIGFIFQTFNLMPHLNSLENVALPLWIADVDEKERIERAKKALKEVGLEDRMLHKPNELSGGQRQRVAIARAIVVNPDIIVADEPTGNLDSKTGETILSLIEEQNRKGKTIILVTHEEEIGQRAKRKIKLKDGLIVSDTK